MTPFSRVLRSIAVDAIITAPWLLSFVNKALLPTKTVRPRRVALALEPLEERWVPAADYTVTSIADTDAMGTLRWAIDQANGKAGTQTIEFDKAAAAKIIKLTKPLIVTDTVIINGANSGWELNGSNLMEQPAGKNAILGHSSPIPTRGWVDRDVS